jgi:hypothetical protein
MRVLLAKNNVLQPRRSRSATSRILASGGLLQSLGDALYQYAPPIKLPQMNVREAAPVDAAAAWTAAETQGSTAGTKLAGEMRTQVKEAMDKMKMKPFYRANLEKAHMEFLTKLENQQREDPAWFNNAANQTALMKEAATLMDPAYIQRAVADSEAKDKDYDQLRSKDQLNQVALKDGRPQDYTYGDFYNQLNQEQNPEVMEQYYQPRRVDLGNGKVKDFGYESFGLDMPNGTIEDANKELTTLQNFIEPSSTETGGTSFSGQGQQVVQNAWKAAGVDGYSYQKMDSTHKTATNAKILGELSKQFNANPSAWRGLMSTAAQSALIADAYRAVAYQPNGVTASQVLKQPEPVLKLGGKRAVDLSGTHVEVRQRLKAAMGKNGTTDAEKKTLQDAYDQLYQYDLQAAEKNVSNRIVQRLGLQWKVDKSDITRIDETNGQVAPGAAGKEPGLDIFASWANGTGLNFESTLGNGPAGGKLPFWSANIDGNADAQEAVKRIAFESDGTTPRTLGALAKIGYTVYNAKTLGGMAWNRSNDASLDKMRVLPGATEIVYLPKNPNDLKLKTGVVAKLERQANQISAELGKLDAVIKSGKPLSPKQTSDYQALKFAQQRNVQEATHTGYVAAVRMRVVARQEDLPNSKAFTNSLEYYDKNGSSKTAYNAKQEITPMTRSFFDLDNADKTGVRSISKDEAIAAGMSTSALGIDNFVTYDVYIGHPNPQSLGSEQSVIRNSNIQNKNQQAEMRQGVINATQMAEDDDDDLSGFNTPTPTAATLNPFSSPSR